MTRYRTLGCCVVAASLLSSAASADITMMDQTPPAQRPPKLVADAQAQDTVVVANQGPSVQGDVVYDDWNMQAFTTGAVLFLGTWGASAIIADTDNHVGANRLYVPLVGPWLALNDWGHCPVTSPNCDNNTTDKFLLVADGVIQAAGLLTMAEGLIFPTSHHRALVADKKIHVTPTGTGLAVLGHF